MIWHFAEVWLLVVVTFIVGCALGALLYGALADSRFAVAQGAVADTIGDLLDGIKARFGSGPAWRQEQMSQVKRASPPPAPPAALPVAERPAHIEPRPVSEPEPSVVYYEEARLVPAPAPLRETLPPEPVAPRLTRAEGDRPRLERPAQPVETAPPGDPVRVAAAVQMSADGVVPMRPAGLLAPRAGVPDNLTRIKGVGRKNEELLNGLGIWHFGQIAAWTPGEVRWIGQYLAFPERIAKDDWVGQAILLASGVDTGFQKSAERRRQRRRAEQLSRTEPPRAPQPADGVSEGDLLAEHVRAAKRRPPEPTGPVDDDWTVELEPEDKGGK